MFYVFATQGVPGARGLPGPRGAAGREVCVSVCMCLCVRELYKNEKILVQYINVMISFFCFFHYKGDEGPVGLPGPTGLEVMFLFLTLLSK